MMDFDALKVGDTVYVCFQSGYTNIRQVVDAIVTRKLKRQFTTETADGKAMVWTDRGSKYGVKHSSFPSRYEWVEMDPAEAAHLKELAARDSRISHAVHELNTKIVDKRLSGWKGAYKRAEFAANLRHVADLFDAIGDEPMKEEPK